MCIINENKDIGLKNLIVLAYHFIGGFRTGQLVYDRTVHRTERHTASIFLQKLKD